MAFISKLRFFGGIFSILSGQRNIKNDSTNGMENELGILDEYGCHAKNCCFQISKYLLFKKSALIGIIADNLEK